MSSTLPQSLVVINQSSTKSNEPRPGKETDRLVFPAFPALSRPWDLLCPPVKSFVLSRVFCFSLRFPLPPKPNLASRAPRGIFDLGLPSLPFPRFEDGPPDVRGLSETASSTATSNALSSSPPSRPPPRSVQVAMEMAKP